MVADIFCAVIFSARRYLECGLGITARNILNVLRRALGFKFEFENVFFASKNKAEFEAAFQARESSQDCASTRGTFQCAEHFGNSCARSKNAVQPRHRGGFPCKLPNALPQICAENRPARENFFNVRFFNFFSNENFAARCGEFPLFSQN